MPGPYFSRLYRPVRWETMTGKADVRTVPPAPGRTLRHLRATSDKSHQPTRIAEKLTKLGLSKSGTSPKFRVPAFRRRQFLPLRTAGNSPGGQAATDMEV